nr:MAG TPA: hypothetical protein [Caudoviricetes sp.]
MEEEKRKEIYWEIRFLTFTFQVLFDPFETKGRMRCIYIIIKRMRLCVVFGYLGN